MKIGAEQKPKVAILAVLGLVAAYLLYSNVFSSPSSAGSQAAARAPAESGRSQPSARPAITRRSATPRIREFKPSLIPNKGDTFDLASIDPTLRFDLLKAVQAIAPEGGQRNLFQFSAPPPPPQPKTPAPKILPKTPEAIAQEQAQQQKAAEAAKSAPPPINLKFFGYSSLRADGRKRAFFLDGEEILVAGEGEIIKKRFKVVRIGVNSVVMEDTQFNNTQTLPLQPAPQGVG
jgi:hypothetical protein